jgi:hypothetical protein
MDLILRKIFAASLWIATAWTAFAQSAPNEYEVKAACLYNFLKYVEWPAPAFAAADNPWIIGVLGEDPFGTVRRAAQLEDITPCQLLFLGRSEKGRVKKVLANLQGASTLTVSEFETFAEQWGIINFVMSGEKIRFEINLSAAQRAGLKMSPKLLDVARIVSPATR